MTHQKGVLNKFMKYFNLTSIVSIYVLLLLWNLKWKSNNIEFKDIFSNPEKTLLFSILTLILFLLVASKDKASGNNINFKAKSVYLLALILLAISLNRVIQLLYNHEYIYNNEITCSNRSGLLLPPSDFQFNVDKDYRIDYDNVNKIAHSINIIQSETKEDDLASITEEEDITIEPESSIINANRRLESEAMNEDLDENDLDENDVEEKDVVDEDVVDEDADKKDVDMIKVNTKKRFLKVIPSFFVRFSPSCDSRSLYVYLAEHVLTPITVSGIIVLSLVIRFFSLVKSRMDLKNIVHFVSLSTLMVLAVTFIMMDHTESVIFSYNYIKALNATLIPVKINFGKVMDNDSVRLYSQFIFSSVPFVWIYILALRLLVLCSLLLVYFKRSFKILILGMCCLSFIVNISGIIFRHERLVNKLFFENKNIDYMINQSSMYNFSAPKSQGNFLIDEEIVNEEGSDEEEEIVGGKRIAFVNYCKEKLIFSYDISNKFTLNLDKFCLSNRNNLLLALMDFSLVVWLYGPNLLLSFLCFILVIVTNKKSSRMNSAENKQKLLNTLIMDLSGEDATEESDEIMKGYNHHHHPIKSSPTCYSQPSYIPRIGSVVSPVNTMSPHYRRPAYIPLNHSHHGSTYTPSLTPCDTPTK